MSKSKSTFNCTNCDYQSIKWLGCCPDCNEWNSFIEVASTRPKGSLRTSGGNASPTIEMKPLSEISLETKKRIFAGCNEWDRVLGGGLMPGSFLILTGDPGIGKSTLLLQIANKLAHKNKVLYFSSEESLGQVKQRASRVIQQESNLLFSDNGNLEAIIQTCEIQKPDILIIDSIQNCYFSDLQVIPGTIGQLREAGFRLMRLSKENNIAVIVTGHVTKEGQIAGPKTLEHLVDAVFYLQGEDQYNTRILRSVKNRFGPVNEIGFFEISANGLQELPNINQQLLQNVTFAPGSVLISSTEGSRPVMLELQALTIPSKFGMPQRVVTGVDHKRVILIAAILEKYLQVKLSTHDIFFKVSGGFTIKESSADLGIALAILSSFFQQPVCEGSIALGEINLTGQIKPINNLAIHANEAQKFGMKKLFVSRNQNIENCAIKFEKFNNVFELLKLFIDN
jgi:DNA repair protein RadA/Sms